MCKEKLKFEVGLDENETNQIAGVYQNWTEYIKDGYLALLFNPTGEELDNHTIHLWIMEQAED